MGLDRVFSRVSTEVVLVGLEEQAIMVTLATLLVTCYALVLEGDFSMFHRQMSFS